VRHRLSLIEPRDAEAWSRDICARVAGAPFFGSIPRGVAAMLYSPLPGEVDVRPLAGITGQSYLGVERTYYQPTDSSLQRKALDDRLADLKRLRSQRVAEGPPPS